MALLVGIDEAGFGPILGPLVVSCCVFQGPAEVLQSDLWQTLHRSVCQARRKQNGRLLIADSKKVHSKTSGCRDLERSVGAALWAMDKSPAHLQQLLEILCPDALGRLEQYPWYQQLDGCLLQGDRADRELAGHVFATDLARHHMQLLDIKSHCLDVGTYNQQVQAMRNKARVLLSASCRWIQDAWDRQDHKTLEVVVDRQGGRMHYRASLQQVFPGLEMRILEENDQVSRYAMTDGTRMMKIHFRVKADVHSLPVSLASMTSKWLRELLMMQINQYWQGHCHELQPTAGYWQDGTRFIQDIRSRVPHVSFNEQLFIRCR